MLSGVLLVNMVTVVYLQREIGGRVQSQCTRGIQGRYLRLGNTLTETRRRRDTAFANSPIKLRRTSAGRDLRLSEDETEDDTFLL